MAVSPISRCVATPVPGRGSGLSPAARRAATGLLALSWILVLPVDLSAQERPFPYALDHGDIAVASVGAVAAGLGFALKNTAAPPTAAEIAGLDRASVNAFDRGATWNWSDDWQDVSDWTRDGLVAAATLATLLPAAVEGRWSEAATLGVMLAETAAFSFGVTNLAKVVVQRNRPYLYNDAFTPEERAGIARESGGATLSFPSGHTSLAFAAASFLSTTYADLHGPGTASKLIWGSSLGAAALVGVARVEGGKHFPTDVLAGAVAGGAIGHLVPRLHRRGTPVNLVVTPSYLVVRWSF